jgi:hypothetical protein
MLGYKRRPFLAMALLSLLCASLLGMAFQTAVFAQDDETLSGSKLVISSTDSGSVPTFVLRVYGIDQDGNPVSLDDETIDVFHDGQAVNEVEIAGGYEAGTLTIFIVDVPPGVSSRLPAIQQAIEEYASPPNMKERADYIAVYRVGESEAFQLQSPINFYNTIRNFFSTPLEPQSGPTALVDSLGSLPDNVAALRPKDDMFTSIVVITDGTDAVSTQFNPDEIGQKAAELGIPVHTIWVENENLQTFSHQAGQAYLSQVAADSGGLSARLDEPEELQAIWDRIADFRTHTVIQYMPADISAGDHEVVVSLRSDPDVKAVASVNVAAAAPSVVINLPPESRNLTLPNLDEPVELTFSTSISWLDGQDRQLAGAQLLVNGVPVQEIAAGDIGQFSVEVADLNYGPNVVQVAVIDELGQQAKSPAVSLNVDQGETLIPEEIRAGGLLDAPAFRIALACIAALLLLFLLVLTAATTRRWRIFDRLGISRLLRRPPSPGSTYDDAGQMQRHARRADSMRGSFDKDASPSDYGYQTDTDPSAGTISSNKEAVPGEASFPYLEILEAVTRMPSIIQLTRPEHRLGRSPTQSDIAFENDITVSRVHAIIAMEGSDYRLYDEGSTSGTWVNDQTVPEYGYQLMDGDEIRLGAAIMRYRQPS